MDEQERLGKQIKAARQLLGWARVDLCLKSKVSNATVNRIENGIDFPGPERLGRVIDTLTAQGIEFVGDESRFGVVLSPKAGRKK